jgi:hypothetical protein
VQPEPKPWIPSKVEATANSNGTVTVYWFHPFTAGGSPITKYTVYSEFSTDGCTLVAPFASDEVLSCTVSGLPLGEPESFVVVAHNGFGTSPNSTPSKCVFVATVPTAPLGATLGFTGTSLKATWQAPKSNGGSDPDIAAQHGHGVGTE